MSPSDLAYTMSIHYSPGYGYMPTIQDPEGKEVYRGEYRVTPYEALCAALKAKSKMESI